jgi:hypothetical protein
LKGQHLLSAFYFFEVLIATRFTDAIEFPDVEVSLNPWSKGLEDMDAPCQQSHQEVIGLPILAHL